VTINIGGPYGSDWNEMDVNCPTSIHWRKSLVPAPAVIPAPRAYIQFAAVKKLVVGWGMKGGRRRGTGFGIFSSNLNGGKLLR